MAWSPGTSLFLIALVLTVPTPRAGAQEPGSQQDVPPVGSVELFPPGSAGSEPQEERPESRFEDAIETDRDSFTPSVPTAGRGRFIVESSYSFIDNRRGPETHSFPELLARFGVTDWLELRLGWNYEIGGGGNVVSGTEGEDVLGPTISEEGRMLYGLKAALTEQAGWVPGSALIVQGFTPTAGEVTDTQVLVGYVFGWELPRRWKLDAAFRFNSDSEEEDRFTVWTPSVVLKVPVGERVNVHGEYFGLFSRDKAEDFVRHFFSPGIHYLLTPDLELGVRVGWGLNDQSARFFSNVGVAWRF